MLKVLPKISTNAVKKQTFRKVLPAISTIGIVAGSSMGPVIPPHNIKHVPGSSVEDPLSEQIGYFGDKLVDLGQEVGSAVLKGAENLIDGVLDIGAGIADKTDVVVEKIIDTITDLF